MKRRDLACLIGLVAVGLSSAALAQPVGPEVRVNTYTTGSQGNPSVASDGSGHFIVVWDSDGQDGSESAIMGQRFDGNTGRRLGGEFLINNYTTSDQEHPSVAADPSG